MTDEQDSPPPAQFQEYPGDTLAAALARYEIELSAEQQRWLDAYCALLWEWNEKINLTRHTDYERFVGRDVVDTVQLAKQLHENEEVIDIGSGGGVPGITLAILRPDLTVVLTESVGKKARVLSDMIRRLKLPIKVVDQRVEKELDDQRFDATTARAVGPLWKLLTWLEPHWLSAGRLLAIKGPKWSEERGEARHRGLMNELEMRVVATYPLAGTASDSVILKIWPKGGKER